MSKETKKIFSTRILKFTESLKLRADLGRPGKTAEVEGGSSPSNQFFEEVKTNKLWVGKCSLQALSKPRCGRPGIGKYYFEYREWLSSELYRILNINTPLLALSLQLPIMRDN